jgi:hypothetical protein
MPVFKKVIDFITLGSERPIRRLMAYYAALVVLVALLLYVFPASSRLLLGGRVSAAVEGPQLLTDGLQTSIGAAILGPGSVLELALITILALMATLALMLPVSWVYMAARPVRGHNQSLAQALIILPIVVAGIVFIVRDSLALAFSLAGVVAAVRFRTTLRDPRDVVFIFLAIAVGFSAGVQTIAVGALVSITFNLVLLFNWRYDFGKNALEPSAAGQWTEPLKSLALKNGSGGVPDRDIVLALTPQRVDALAERFNRVRNVMGAKKKKPRFNAVLSLSTDRVGEAQVLVQRVLEKMTKRWTLDEVITHNGKPSEIHYLVRIGKSIGRDDLITAIRSRAGDRIATVDVEVAEAVEQEREERAVQEQK